MPFEKGSTESLEKLSNKAERKKKSQKIIDKTSKSAKRQSTTCMICKKQFASKKMLNDHNIKHHFFRHCPNCPKTFQRTRRFILHLRSHLNDKPYECNICLQIFSRKALMLDHKKMHTSSEKLHCDKCPEVFLHSFSFKRHQLTHDVKGPPYDCDMCDAVFYSISDKTVHLKNHLHRCVLCPKQVVVFGSSGELGSHMFSVHLSKESDPPEALVSTGAVSLEEGSDSDSMEDTSSSDNESLIDMDNHYQEEAVEPVYNIKRKDKFICFICYVLYPSPELLKSHMKVHKWYPCNSCPRFFADAKTLENHKCNFAKVPSFMCKNCTAEAKCESCKKNHSKSTVDTSKVNMNTIQSVQPMSQGLPGPVVPYYDAAQRNKLINLIECIKSQTQPLDATTLCHIGSHATSLEMILKDSRVRSLFPEECIPEIEDLYFKFRDLSQTLSNQINRESKQ